MTALAEAIGDCTFVVATTARNHDQAKPVIGAAQAAAEMAPRLKAGENVAMVFGRERNGFENHEVARADRILTLPVNPAFASLNLAQAVVIVGYEWFKQAGGELPFAAPQKSPPAAKQQLDAFFADLERELDKVEFFRPDEKRGTMGVNLRNIFQRMAPSQQDMRTLHGVVTALVQAGRVRRAAACSTAPARRSCAICLAEHGAGRAPSERTPLRGLPRLLRRNPTDAERALWQGLVNDRRFAGFGFKRQVPIGPHMADFVSFPLPLRDRSCAGGRESGGCRGARRKTGVARRARLSRDRGERRRGRARRGEGARRASPRRQPFSAFVCAAMPSRKKPRSLPTAR